MRGMRPLSGPHFPESTTRKSHRQKPPQTPVKGIPPPNFAIFGLPEPASPALSNASDALASPQLVSAFVPADENPPSAAAQVLSPTSILSCTVAELDQLATQVPDVHEVQSDEPVTPVRTKRNVTMHEKLPDESLITKKRRRSHKDDMGGCFAPRCTSARSNLHP